MEKTDDEIEEILQKGHVTMLTKAQHTLDHLELRHRDLIELERSIQELHHTFLDLAHSLRPQV